jgi:hypothetical protein
MKTTERSKRPNSPPKKSNSYKLKLEKKREFGNVTAELEKSEAMKRFDTYRV